MWAGSSEQAVRNVLERLAERLSGQRVHQIEIEIRETGCMQFLDRTVRVRNAVDAAETLERMRPEALGSEGDAIDAGVAIAGEAAALHRAGIRLECDLGIRGEPSPPAQCLEQPGELLRRKQTRRAAAEEDALDFPLADRGQFPLEIEEQRIEVGRRRSG